MGATNVTVNDILDNRGLVRVSYRILKYPAPFRATATPFTSGNYPLVDEEEEEDITSFVKDWGINKSQGVGAAQLSLEVPFDPEDGSSPTFEPNDVVIVFERIREESSLKSSGWIRHGIFLIDDYPKSVDDYTWRITATDGFKITTTKKFVGIFEAETVDYDRDTTTLTQVDQGSYYSYVHVIDAGIPFDDRWYNWAAEPPPLIYWREDPGDTWQRLFENDNVQVIKSAGEVRINKEYYDELFDDGAGGVFTPTISITYSRYKAEWENTDFSVWNSGRSAITEVLLDAGFHEEAEDFPALFFIPSDERFTEPRYETKFDKIWDFVSIGSVYTDKTTEAGDLTEDDVILPGAVGDILYAGAINRHREIIFEVDTAATGSWTYVWEYWDGAAYQTVAPDEDETSGFTQTGRVKFGIFPSTGTGAKFNTVNSAGPYWYLRLRCTSAGTTPAQCRRVLISAGVALPKTQYRQDDDITHQKVINDILDFCKPNYVIRVDSSSHVRTYEVVQKTTEDYQLDTIENAEVAGSDKDLHTKIVYRGRIPDPINVALDSEGSIATAFYASAIRKAKKRIGRRAEPETPIDGSSMTFMEWHFNATGGTPAVLDDQHVLWKLVLNGGSPVVIGEGTRFLVSGGPSVASWTIEWSNDDVTYDYFSYDAIDVAIPDGNPLEIEGSRIIPSTVTYLRFRCTQFHIEQDLDTGIGGVDEEIIQEASLREVVLFENDVIRKTVELGVTPPFDTAPFIALAKRLQPRELILDVDEFAATEFYVDEKARIYLRYSYRQFDALKASALRPDIDIHESVKVVVPQEGIDQIYVVEDVTKGKGGVCEVYLVRYEPDG